MKKIIVSLIFIISAFYSYAQVDTISQNIGQSNVFQIIHFKGGVTGDYSVMIPVKDTLDNKALTIRGALTVRPQDSLLYMSNGARWIPFLATNNNFVIDSVYVERPLAVKIGTSGASLGKQVIYFLKESGLISGGIPLSTGCRTLTMPPSIYIINYNQYTSISTNLTIDTSSATLNRTDRIVGDTFGIISVIKGTPSSQGLEPPYNPSSQFSLATISIPAASTCTPATNFSMTLYDQNLQVAGGEWDIAYSGTITADGDNTDNPLHLTKAMFISVYSDSSQVSLTHTGSQDTVTSSSVFILPTYLNIVLTNPVQAQFFLNSTAVSNNTVINSFINPNDTGNYQIPVIPFSAFGFNSQIYNKVVLTFRGYDTSGAAGLYFDWIRIQKGINGFDFKLYVDSTKIISGNEYYYKGGIAYLAGAVGSTVTPAALTKTDDTNVTLTLGGTPTTALLQATSLTLGWTGNLAATRGGTGTATVTTGDLLYGSATNTWSKLGIGTTGQTLHIVGGLPVWRDTSSAFVNSAGNGLTDSSNRIILGGSLYKNTTIATSASTLTLSTSTAAKNPLAINATTGVGLFVNTTTGTGIESDASGTGFGVVGYSAGGIGIQAWSDASYGLQVVTNPSSTNTVFPSLSFQRQSSGTAADGIGLSVDFLNQNITFGSNISNKLISKWTTAAFATRTSEFSITGVNSAVTGTLATFSGNGAVKFNSYGAGTFTGTYTKSPAFASDGSIIEVSSPVITSGTVAPASTPAKIGDIYVDTTAKKLYFAAGNSSSADWIIAN